MSTHSDELDAAGDSTGVRESLESDSRATLGRRERAVSAVIGGLLLVRGVKRRSIGGVATAAIGGALLARGISGRSRLYRLLGTETAAGHERAESDATRVPTVERSIVVGEAAEDLDEYWRDPERLTRLVGGFADVSAPDPDDADRHRWRVRGPLDRRLEWETRLVEHEPGERMRWETVEGAPLPYEATIEFEPESGDRGTTVTLRVRYDPPGGSLGDGAMQRLGIVPESLAGQALRRFKSLVETGEIPSTEANPSARGKGDLV